ncbi:hypothetical protein K2173_014677 [Erythroxylum novogranatense]|uniref:RRM domain-containing protein n=1 Tax=Erythroxylum novogranatense TaxID=1862640 RepID=A0AAV8THM3_9ROSI|nr:hypothetical protein K2173_014677 [Erythroxylum novogranatense]
MEFDEIEYLEKTVEEAEDREGSKNKKKTQREGNNENSYRKRDFNDNEDIEERKGKRSRVEEENGGKRSKDKDRHRRDRDGDMDFERERVSREKERERSRDSDRDRERSSREKERHRERKDREKERERERDVERDRRERKERDKEDERDRSGSRSRRYRSPGPSDRDGERERELDLRENRRSKEKREAIRPEADPERDQRTVFAYQMPLKATERDVYEFFSKAGKVRDVRLIVDRNSRRSKGVGYIEFYDAMSVPMAIALSGQLLLGQPVMVKPSEAEKNLVQSTASSGGTGGVTGPYGPVDRKLYVGNLHFNMTEMQLRQLFEPFGAVELVQLPLDLETGQCKGFGFVQFAQVENAKAAQSALNGKLEIAGRTIKVSSVAEHGVQQDTAAKSADFDDDEGGGLALNAQSRAWLMWKLDRTGIATSIAGSLGVPVLNGSAPTQQAINLPIPGQATVGTATLSGQVFPAPAYEAIGQPGECLLLKNMFDPATETEPDFDLDIKEDVAEECSKYGRVKHIFVDKNSAGHVYLRYESVEAAARAQRAMHMRWFARRSISAIFMQPQEYEAKFRS